MIKFARISKNKIFWAVLGPLGPNPGEPDFSVHPNWDALLQNKLIWFDLIWFDMTCDMTKKDFENVDDFYLLTNIVRTFWKSLLLQKKY